jgi:hypothetical protein
MARVKRLHARWLRLQVLFGAFPLFALFNRFQPILTDGNGRDMIPGLLPVYLGRHLNLLLALSLAGLAVSEILRRRFHSRNKDLLDF